MWELFRGEVESQMRVLTSELLALENSESPKEQLASAMRAAHSIKGAARIVNLNIAVTLAHTMEDCLVAAQEGALTLNPQAIDALLQSADLLAQVATVEESAVPEWIEQQGAAVDALIGRLTEVRSRKIIETPAPPVSSAVLAPAPVEQTAGSVQQSEKPSAPRTETASASAQAAAPSAAPASKVPARASRPG
jgi:two-component system sensor histidine kinase and response regulator WspE